MSENSRNERQLLNSRIAYIKQFFDTNITDPNIREYIFNSPDYARCITKKVADYVIYINNIITLSFAYAYGCFHYETDAKEVPSYLSVTEHNSLRIINSMKRTYVQYPASSELMQFILSDIQFDMLGGVDGGLYDIFHRMCNFNAIKLTKYFKLIDKWRASPSRFNMNINELAEMFSDLIENMSFLSNYILLQKDADRFEFVEKRYLQLQKKTDFSVIPVDHILYRDTEKFFGFFNLFSVERMGEIGLTDERRLIARYISSDGFNSVVLTVSMNKSEDEFHLLKDPEEFFAEITGEAWEYSVDQEGNGQGGNAGFINQVHTINYKYIKNLALSISDAISDNVDAKKAIHKAFYKYYPYIFSKESDGFDYTSTQIDWDGIIVMLLIEASPSRVLEVLIKKNRQIFLSIVKNLCKRVDNPNMPIYGLNRNELDKKVYEIIEEKLVVGGTESLEKMGRSSAKDKLYPYAATVLIIASLTTAYDDIPDDRLVYAGNIYDNIAFLQSLQNDKGEVGQKLRYVCITIGETFRRLICFYQGVFAYGRLKAEFDTESADVCLPKERILYYQKELNSSFLQAAQRAAEELSSLDSVNPEDVVALIQRFMDLCQKCSSTSLSYNEQGRYLYTTLGKYEIMDIDAVNASIRKHLGTLCKITPENYEKWTKFALEVLGYLQTGSLTDTNPERGIFEAVHPFVATYSRGNENYDGYRTVTFSLGIDLDADGKYDAKDDVNVLSEFYYTLGEVFYCLPNVLRSNLKWWIDPILISFKEFNDIFNQ